MRSAALSVLLSLLLAASLCGGPPQRLPITPGLHKKPIEMPLDPPISIPRTAVIPSHLQGEAAELAQLSAGIPESIARVKQGQLPKELSQQLKRIEKLAKHLRSELAP